MHGTPARTGFRLAFKCRVAGAHESLADVVEAVCRVVGDLLREVGAAVALLEMLDEVRLHRVSKIPLMMMISQESDSRDSEADGKLTACILVRHVFDL